MAFFLLVGTFKSKTYQKSLAACWAETLDVGYLTLCTQELLMYTCIHTHTCTHACMQLPEAPEGAFCVSYNVDRQIDGTQGVHFEWAINYFFWDTFPTLSKTQLHPAPFSTNFGSGQSFCGAYLGPYCTSESSRSSRFPQPKAQRSLGAIQDTLSFTSKCRSSVICFFTLTEIFSD